MFEAHTHTISVLSVASVDAHAGIFEHIPLSYKQYGFDTQLFEPQTHGGFAISPSVLLQTGYSQRDWVSVHIWSGKQSMSPHAQCSGCVISPFGCGHFAYDRQSF